MPRILASLLASMLLAPAVLAQNMLERYNAGQHYFPIDPPVATSAPAGKVEVVEVFSYGCIHCAEFNPSVDKWKQSKPAAAQFVLMPVVFNPSWEALARAYYAAEALGVVDRTHDLLFKALFVEKKQFRTIEELAKWYATQGVDEAKFLATAKSFGVNAKIKRASDLVARYRVDGTPSVIVAGKYRVTGASAGSYEDLWQVVNYLIAKELATGAASTAQR